MMFPFVTADIILLQIGVHRFVNRSASYILLPVPFLLREVPSVWRAITFEVERALLHVTSFRVRDSSFRCMIFVDTERTDGARDTICATFAKRTAIKSDGQTRTHVYFVAKSVCALGLGWQRDKYLRRKWNRARFNIFIYPVTQQRLARKFTHTYVSRKGENFVFMYLTREICAHLVSSSRIFPRTGKNLGKLIGNYLLIFVIISVASFVFCFRSGSKKYDRISRYFARVANLYR